MEIEIATIEKNKIEELHVALKEFKGHHYADIRTYCDPYADEGQGRVPTKKGVTLSLTKLPKLIAALQQAEARHERQGCSQIRTEPPEECGHPMACQQSDLDRSRGYGVVDGSASYR